MSSNIIFVFIFSCALIPRFVLAQDSLYHQKIWKPQPRHEISIGYGGWSMVQLMEGVVSGEEGFTSRPIKYPIGPLCVTYRYLLFPKISIGINIAYEYDDGDMAQLNTRTGNGATYTEGTFNRNVLTVVPEILLYYTREEGRSIEPYGYFGIGKSYLQETDYPDGVNTQGKKYQTSTNTGETSLQICPFGFSFGGTKLRGFAEIGFGYKGVLNGGLAFRL